MGQRDILHERSSSMIHRIDIVHAARPLRHVFWGALLVLLDVAFAVSSGGEGFRIDILNDTLGMALITAAVARLRGIPVSASYATRMKFIHWVSILGVIETAVGHLIFAQPWLLTFLLQILGMAKIVALLLFCACMRDLCVEGMLAEAARRWRTTLALFVALYGIPLGLLQIAGIITMSTGDSFYIDLGPGMLVIGAIFFVPLVSFFRATSTMARSAEMPAFPMAAIASPRVTAPHAGSPRDRGHGRLTRSGSFAITPST
jgi:hypothetical protein